MEEISVSSFREFIKKLESIAKKHRITDIYTINTPGKILYRGQSDSSWGLQTTLERHSQIKTLIGYLGLCLKIRPLIETEYNVEFSKMTEEHIYKWFQSAKVNTPTQWFGYPLYLRHHGFPSPLMDWTQSPYVALGFAFFDESRARNRAVFMCIEKNAFDIKNHPDGDPIIRKISQHIRTSKRHFLQQSMYTLRYTQNKKTVTFFPYNRATPIFSYGEGDYEPTYQFVKFIIPASEREQILKFLFSVNITPYSIMPSEENFMKTLWMKEHRFRSKE